MPQLLKKIFSLPKLLSKKQGFFFLLASLFSFLFLPVLTRAVAWLNPLTWAQKVSEVFLGLILQIILAIANAGLTIVMLLFGWIIQKGGAITLSYTNPATNPIIGVGWTLTRDLTNMFFILGLVYIGLATALRIGGFQTKKIFPILLAVALLINFTPTICGIVVDASNLVMNFFLEDLAGWEGFTRVWSQYGSTFKDIYAVAAPSVASLARIIVLIFYAVSLTIILWCFIFLFFARYIAIWLLVILSPFAFFALIFSKSRDFFSKWWSQFLAWSFVGATGAFFLYLGQYILFEASKRTIVKEVDGTMAAVLTTDFTGMFNNLLPYAVPIIFLYVGYILALKSSAMGANKVVAFGKAVGRKALGFAWQNVGKKAAGKLGGLTKAKTAEEEAKMGKTGKKLHSAAKYLGLRALTEKEEEAWAGKSKAARLKRKLIKGAVGAFTGGFPFWAQRVGRRIEAIETEATRKEIDDAEGKGKGKSLAKQVDLLKKSVSHLKKIGSLLAIIKDGNLEDAKDLYGLRDSEIENILEKALTLAPAAAKELGQAEPVAVDSLLTARKGEAGEEEGKLRKGMVSRFGAQLKQAGLTMSDDDYKKFGTLGQKLMAKAKGSVIENQWTTDTMKTAVATRPVHQFWDPRQWAAAGRKFSVAFFDELTEQRQKLKISAPWYAQYNPPAFRYFRSSPAQGEGIGFVEEEGEWVPAPARKMPPEGPGTRPVDEIEKERKEKKREAAEKPPEKKAPPPEEKGEAGLTE